MCNWKNICCWLLCCYFSVAALSAQSLILEDMRLHTDRQLYVSGETIWLKLYVTDALAFRPSTLSAIAFVELWDVQGDIIFQTKVALERGLGTASIEIPLSLQTGEYLIRSYTRWMANGSPDKFAHQPIIIVNPKQAIPLRDTSQLPEGLQEVLLSSSTGSGTVNSQASLHVNLSLDKTQIGTREKVELNILTKDSLGTPVSAQLSLSIAKAFLVDQVIGSPYVHARSDTALQPEADQLPDLYGLNLSGTVVNEFDQVIPGAHVFFCIPGATPHVQFARTTPEGWFRFLLPDLYGNHEVLLAARDVRGQKLQVKLDSDILGGRPRLPDWSLTFPEDVVGELQAYIVQKQIQNAYQSSSSTLEPEQEHRLRPFYQKADHVYILDEYTRFSMEETFPEIIYSVSLRKRQKQPIARVFNSTTGLVMDGDPLILIDGVPVPDMSDLLALQSKEVERIEVLTYPYYLHGQVYDGIVHAITFQGDASKIKIPDGAIRRPYAFLSPERGFQQFEAEGENAHRIPDMRRLLLWDPMIQTDEQGKAQLTFWTSDIKGKFEFRIQGLTENGLWGEKDMEMRVVEKNKP